MRPVANKMCTYESLLEGRLRLVDIAKMNEALDVQEENHFRIVQAQEK
jgi:hypothetical protein